MREGSWFEACFGKMTRIVRGKGSKKRKNERSEERNKKAKARKGERIVIKEYWRR